MEIPGYRTVRLLGEGGMAKVWLAVQEKFEREVALKIMSPALASSDAEFQKRFVREAHIVAQLMHPNIVTIFDAGVHEGLHYLSMEYVPGQDLRKKSAQLTLKQNLSAVKQIALALHFAHEKGYLHRDIKPENILIHDHDGRAVLTDFGIARITGTDEHLTQTGVAMGTPSFMSPEQALGRTVDARSDLYSLGAVLFCLLAGRTPYSGDSAVSIGIKHATEAVPRLPGKLAFFQPLLEKAMAKTLEQRFQNGHDFADAIDQVSAQLTPEIAPDIEAAWKDALVHPDAAPANEQTVLNIDAAIGPATFTTGKTSAQTTANATATVRQTQAASTTAASPHAGANAESDVEHLLAERARLETLFKDKFTRTITVMFTDLKGSTSIAEAEGDLATRSFLKTHNDLLFPCVAGHNGVMVKTMGDGTMSYFEQAQDAARAAVAIQEAFRHYNLEQKPKVPLLVRIGVNTGVGIVEANDIFGDVVNTASRFEALADAGEIYLSETAFQALSDPAEFYCRNIKMTKIKGKQGEHKVFKLFWLLSEIDADKAVLSAAPSSSKTAAGKGSWLRLLLMVGVLIAAVYVAMNGLQWLSVNGDAPQQRSDEILLPSDVAPVESTPPADTGAKPEAGADAT